MQVSCPACSDPIPTRSVSETQFKANMVSEMKKNGAPMSAREGIIPYVSVTVFTDELVLELCVRWQVYRCAPHGVIGRIQRDLHSARVYQ
jgi:hypothetical protein